VRDAHKRVDPQLSRVDGSSEHLAACLLESSVRSRIWAGIQTGRDQDSLLRMAASSPEPEVPVAAEDEPESEGTDIEPSEEGVTESERPGTHPTGPPIETELQRTRRGDTPGPGSG
jgi:hypothetical protein